MATCDRRRAAVWLFLAAVLLLGGWWTVWRRADETGRPLGVADPIVGVGDEGRTPDPDAAPPAPSPARLEGLAEASSVLPQAPLATLRCQVLDPEGSPRPRSFVRLEREEPADPPPHPPPGYETTVWRRYRELERLPTSVQGVVAFGDLPPGRYRLEALAPPGLLAAARTVDLTSTGLRVELRYRRCADARIEVLDPAGMPVAGAVVSLKRTFADARTTDTHGVALLTGLDPEWDAALEVKPPRGLELFPRTLDPWPVRDTRVVLERGLAVSGRVVDDAGEPVPRGRVYRRKGAGTWHSRPAEEDGSFRFTLLRAGETLTLRAGPPGSWSAVTEPETVEAGAGDVLLVLPHSGRLEVVVEGWVAEARGTLYLTVPSQHPARRSAEIGADGRLTFRYLDPRARHVLWGVLRGDDRFLYRDPVRAQEEPLSLRLQNGDPIHVRVTAPEGIFVRSVHAGRPGVNRQASLLPLPDGSLRIPPLPPGRWIVQAYGAPVSSTGHPRTFYRAETTAEPGARVELTLEKGD